MQPDWDKLEKDFADTPNVVIANADCSGNAQSFCGEHGVQGYPSLKIIKDGRPSDYNGGRDYRSLKREVETKLNPKPACSLESKDACSKQDLAVLEESEKMTKAERAAKIKEVQASVKSKREEAEKLTKEAKALEQSLDLIKAGGVKPEIVEQMVNDADMRAHCEGRTCVIAFLPHILDDQAKGRNERLKMLNSVLATAKKDGKNVGWMWSQGGDQFEMEEALGLQFGFPAVIAINLKKNVFGVHRGTVDADALKLFITSLTSTGGVPLVPLPASFKVDKQTPWDGKDGQLPDEDL